jgi:hypothetical protein
LDVSFEGFDVITAIECLYYLSPSEQGACLERVRREHRGILTISVPIVGTLNSSSYFTHSEIMATLQRHGMAVIEYRNMMPRSDNFAKRAAAFAIRKMPFGHALIERLPEALIYQRCYIARVGG